MIAKISMAICLIAMVAMASIDFACYETQADSSIDVLGILVFFGPYVVQGLIAWRWRAHPVISVVALVLILILASGGLWLIGYDCYHYQVSPDYRLYERYALLATVVLQYLGTALLGLFVLVVWLISKRGQKGQ